MRVVVRDELASEAGSRALAPPLRRGFDSSADLARFVEEDRWEPRRAPSSAPPHVATLPPPYGLPRAEPDPDDWVAALPPPPRLASLGHAVDDTGSRELEDLPWDRPEASYASDLLEDETPLASAPEEFTPAPPDHAPVGLEQAAPSEAASRRPRYDSSAFWEEAARELWRRPSSVPPPLSSGMLPPALTAPARPRDLVETQGEESPLDARAVASELEQPSPSFAAPPSAPPPPSSPLSEPSPSAEARARRRRSFRTIPPRRRLVKPPSMVVKIHGGLAALGVLGAVAVLWVVLRSPPSTGAPERVAATRPEPARLDARPQQDEDAPSGAPPRAPALVDHDTEAVRGDSVASPEPTSRPAPADAPPAADIPEGQAALRVLVAPPRWVFINGKKAGESNAWLIVPCGWRHVRLAERQPPPPGASFPAWTNEGHSVLIPCGESSEIALAE